MRVPFVPTMKTDGPRSAQGRSEAGALPHLNFSGAMVVDLLFAVEGKNRAGELYFVCLITYA